MQKEGFYDFYMAGIEIALAWNDAVRQYFKHLGIALFQKINYNYRWRTLNFVVFWHNYGVCRRGTWIVLVREDVVRGVWGIC